MSRPAKTTRPESGRISPATSLSSTLLPLAPGPISPQRQPVGTEMSTPSRRRGAWGNDFETFSSWTIASRRAPDEGGRQRARQRPDRPGRRAGEPGKPYHARPSGQPAADDARRPLDVHGPRPPP